MTKNTISDPKARQNKHLPEDLAHDNYDAFLKQRRKNLIHAYGTLAAYRMHWIRRNSYYYSFLARLLKKHIEPYRSVMDIGCGNGHLMHQLHHADSQGLDLCPEMVREAKKMFPELNFSIGDIENLASVNKMFDYLLMVNVIGDLTDVPKAFGEAKKISQRHTRLIIVYYNHFWEPVVKFAEKLKLKMKQPAQNWLSLTDVGNMLHLSGWEIVKKDYALLCPINVPVVSWIANKILGNIPFLKKLGFVQYVIARPVCNEKVNDSSCTVVIPCKNERGNIQDAVQRIPLMGKGTEIIFVDDQSDDGTGQEIDRLIKMYPEKNIRKILGPGISKAKAVWAGFENATGDILMILDGDLTVMPEELPMFYEALVSGKGEFINGCRLVYDMEEGSMRILNIIGNKFFGVAFSYLLSQKVKDTLCGTKVFWRTDYLRMKSLFGAFGNYDRWGDYDLLFSASKLNMKIIDMPIHYRERIFGETKMNKRFRHGMMMLRMCMIAAKELKWNV